MKKYLFLLIVSILHFYSFGQIPVITNPSVPNPRPLKQGEILRSRFGDLNDINTGIRQQKPTGIRQRMIASSSTGTYTQGPKLIDSIRYVYSGNRGSYSYLTMGNINEISQFDSSFRVHLSPDSLYTPPGLPYIAYSYNSDNLPVYGRSYDSTKKMVIEQTRNYFLNDSVSAIKTINHNVDSLTTFTQETFYNEKGLAIKDSLVILSIYPGGMNDSLYFVKNVYFDSLNRVDYIDSIYRNYQGSSDYLQRYTLKNFYSSENSVFPDSDSIITISYNMLPYTDTGLILKNHYYYNTSNYLTSADHYNYNPYLMQFLPYAKEIYTYNNAGQISSEVFQVGQNGSLVNSQKHVYQYDQDINTVYIVYNSSNDTDFSEIGRTVSSFDENRIIDSVKDYYFDSYSYLATYTTNNFKNQTSINYFEIENNIPFLYNHRNYYYEEYDDPTSTVTVKQNQLDVQLFPNPASQTLNYKIGAAQNKNITITIYNIAGNLLYQNNFKSNTGKIDISGFKTGNYIFEATNLSDGSSQKIKFIKE